MDPQCDPVPEFSDTTYYDVDAPASPASPNISQAFYDASAKSLPGRVRRRPWPLPWMNHTYPVQLLAFLARQTLTVARRPKQVSLPEFMKYPRLYGRAGTEWRLGQPIPPIPSYLTKSTYITTMCFLLPE